MAVTNWEDVRPVLVALYRALEGSESLQPSIGTREINVELGRHIWDPEHDRALRYLKEDDYITGHRTGDLDDRWALLELAPRGLEEVAGWPATPGADYGAKLLDLLDERINEAEGEEQRSRLERARDALGSMGKDVLTGVLTDLARRGI